MNVEFIERLNLTDDEKKVIDIVYNTNHFLDVMNKIINTKRIIIADEVENQEDLTKARFTKIGNEEVRDIFEAVSNEFREDIKEDFDERAIVDPQ